MIIMRCRNNSYFQVLVKNRPLWLACGDSHLIRGLTLNCQLWIVNYQLSINRSEISGGYCGGVPPLPIPNREVKPACADGTAMQCGRVGGRHFSCRKATRGALSSTMVKGLLRFFSWLMPDVVSRKHHVFRGSACGSRASGNRGLCRLGWVA